MAWTRRLPSGKYAGKYRGPDGVERTADGGPWTHKAAARRAAEAAEAQSRAPGWRDPAAGLRTWGDWCETWWPTRTVEESTMRSDVGRRDKHLLTRWGDVPLVDITRLDVKAWAAELRKTVPSDSTVERIVSLFSASLAGAMDAEVLMANPAARLKLPSGKPTVERYLEHEEFDAIAEHLEGEWLAMAELLVNTGQRFGEAAGLHRHRVNPSQQMARIVEAWSPAAGAIKLYTKGKRRRQVPWLDWVDLDDEPRWTTCGVKHPGCRSGLVVPSRAGTPIDGANFRKRFDAACKAAGVGHVRPHDLRHTYASWLLQDGTTLAEVGKLLGHTSSATTERYAHLQEKPSEAAVNALRRARRAADVQQPAATDGSTALQRGHLRLVK